MNKKRKIWGLIAVVLLLGTAIVVAQKDTQKVSEEEEKIIMPIPQKPVFDLNDNQIKELTEKGIIKYYSDGTREINLYDALKEIKKAQQYSTTNDGNILAGEYRHAYMVTRHWLWGDQYKYRGHTVYVKIPSNVNLNSQTSFNLYNTHMGLSSGKYFEVGVGWFNSWGLTGLHLYTYDSYSGTLSNKPIPSGLSRDIYLKLDTWEGSPNRGYMYAFDTYSRTSISKTINIDGLNHRVDETQEQHSCSQTWTSTSVAKHYKNIIKKNNGQWTDWNSGIPTKFIAESPLKEIHGTENNKYYIKTWCQ